MIFQCWKLGKKIKAFHFIHIYYCQYFIHASSSCLRICVVEPHCKTSNEGRHSDLLLTSTVVIVFNSVCCVFSKPCLAHSVLLVCGMLCWITMGFYYIQTHLIFPPGRFADVIWVPKSLWVYFTFMEVSSSINMIMTIFCRVLIIYVNKEIGSQLCLECKNLYMIPSVGFPEGPQRARTSLRSFFGNRTSLVLFTLWQPNQFARFSFKFFPSKIHDTSLITLALTLERKDHVLKMYCLKQWGFPRLSLIMEVSQS